MAHFVQASREAGADHWKAWYNAVRDDGGQVFVKLHCTEAAIAAAKAAGNQPALDAIENAGEKLALRLAEEAQPGRGVCHVEVFFDPSREGTPRASYEYEQPAGKNP